MTTAELLTFLRTQRWAAQATVSSVARPQAALVGVAFTDQLEVVFDTVTSTRKFANLRLNARVAFVIGGWVRGDERTVQYEGIADVPSGAELERLKEAYFEVFPDGRARQSWAGLVYVRVRPTWIRYSDFNASPPTLSEFQFAS